MEFSEEELERWMAHRAPGLHELWRTHDGRMEIKDLVERVEENLNTEWEERLNS